MKINVHRYEIMLFWSDASFFVNSSSIHTWCTLHTLQHISNAPNHTGCSCCSSANSLSWHGDLKTSTWTCVIKRLCMHSYEYYFNFMEKILYNIYMQYLYLLVYCRLEICSMCSVSIIVCTWQACSKAIWQLTLQSMRHVTRLERPGVKFEPVALCCMPAPPPTCLPVYLKMHLSNNKGSKSTRNNLKIVIWTCWSRCWSGVMLCSLLLCITNKLIFKRFV